MASALRGLLGGTVQSFLQYDRVGLSPLGRGTCSGSSVGSKPASLCPCLDTALPWTEQEAELRTGVHVRLPGGLASSFYR